MTPTARTAVGRAGVDALTPLEEVFESVPASIAVLRGRDHRFQLANRAYRDLVGGRELLGLSLREALPEIESQGFLALLDRVFETGEPHRGDETPVLLDRRGDGRLEQAFVNFVYLPMRGPDGRVDGILVHAVDVTELATARRTVEALADELAGERRRLETVVEQMPAGVVIAEVPSGRLVAANQEWREFFGVSVDAIGNVESYALFSAQHPDGRDYRPEEYPLARTVATGETVAGEQMMLERSDGASRIIEVNSAPIVHEGRIETAVATFFDVTEQRRTAMLVERNKSLLELIAAGAPLHESLESIVRMIEEQAGGTILASILLLDRDGTHLRHGAAPSLPQAYNEAIDGIQIGPTVGSCGTAAHFGRPVVVTDIGSDPLWADFKELALAHGLHSCWSTPIPSADGRVLGTFAIYGREPKEPRPEEQTLVEIATRTAAIAIERKRLEEERERTLQVVQSLHRVGQAINASLDLQQVVQVVTDAATELTGAQFGAFFYNVIREDGEAYTLYTLSGVPRSAFERFPMPRNTKIFDPTFRGTAVMRFDDVRADPRYGQNPPYHGMPEGHLPVRSYLAAPVKNTEGEVLGGLFFGHADVGVFDERAEQLVVGIAAQAAIAIERAQLYVREQHARAQAERRAHAALSLEHVDDGVCLVDDEGIVQVWNPAATSITGVAEGDVVGRALGDAAPDLAAAAAALEPAAGPQPRSRARSFAVRVGERELWLAIAAVAFPGGVVYTFRDRSEERRLDQMRSDIIATVSHELRTPLSAVYGAARTLTQARVADDAELRDRFIEMIVGETERLNRVVNQILLTSELSARAQDVAPAAIDVASVARRVVDLATLRTDGIALELVIDDDAPPVVADGDRLQQVIANLVDNAIKYGAAGGRVAVHVRRDGAFVRLEVVDGGPGVPESERERIFERFYRLDPEQRQGVAGTGLGLHITREIVRSLGGEIWVESGDGGCGSTFVVRLPAAMR